MPASYATPQTRARAPLRVLSPVVELLERGANDAAAVGVKALEGGELVQFVVERGLLFTGAFAAAAMASMIILRRCCQQSPRYVLYFRSRSSSVIASHAALPTFASTATIAAAATMRRVQRAPLHVSVIRTVPSHKRCRPIFSGDGPPAAAQLPAPFSFSCCAIHAVRTRRE